MANGLFELEAYVKPRLKDSSGNPVQCTLSEGKLAGLCGARDPASVFFPRLGRTSRLERMACPPHQKGQFQQLTRPFVRGKPQKN